MAAIAGGYPALPVVLGAGTAWFENGFDDEQWLSGPAPFGYGYGDVATNLAPSIQGRSASARRVAS